ncbi:Aste57867_6878 [Aphanomyces stellatus]|uniref:Aste57867_6878 protein n=1 Tax=Aphanomyces stellatus TaxID=120398 RepID=A0A485KGQ4_9STRA|nr:hypothetical protein As57867_006857 [Aphanomyces stellatus]VFT83835.1 Aste57867_6878 [Aphanomyces stellatus]
MEHDGRWDVMEDLNFLFANDAELQDDLLHVCEILSRASEETSDAISETTASVETSTLRPPTKHHVSTPASSTKPDTRKRARRPNFESRQKEQIEHLRDQVKTLTAHLRTSAVPSDTSSATSFWKRTAMTACLEKNRAILEHEQLQDAVAQQATFIEQMQRVFRKKPRLAAVRLYIPSLPPSKCSCTHVYT